jgi:hypothetical protein
VRKKKKTKTKAAMMKKAMTTKRRKRRRKSPKTSNRNSLNVFTLDKRWLMIGAMNRSCPAEKHHFDACAARVAKAAENPDKEHHGHPEDCAEEFLHLMHCVDKTIAEPLFKQLK